MLRPQLLLFLTLSLVLTGCGFQLRGASSVPEAVQPLALDCTSTASDRLCRAVENQLRMANVSMAEVNDAAAVLILRDFRQERRANAVTARAGAAEYTLRQTVRVEVISANQTPLIAPDTVTSTETYRYDETNVLAKQQEEEALQEELYQRLAQQVIFRLAPLNQTRLDAQGAAQ